MSGLKILYNLILKDAARGSGQASGILSIGKDVRKLADKKFQRYVTTAKNQNVDLDKLGEQDIKYMLELNKPKAPQVLSNEEAYEFLNQFLNQGKKGEVIRGKFKPLVTVDSVITDIKKLKPIDSMKETNKVLKGEGKYKNLSKADREKIAGDESVTDHIFERNIEPDPEDFAYGGVAGMLGERTGYNKGGSISDVLPADFDELDHDELMHIIKLLQAGEIPKFAQGGVAGLLGERPGYSMGTSALSPLGLTQTMYPEGDFLNIKANAPTQKDYNIQATKDLVENLPGGVVKDVLAPAAAATLSLPYDAIQASQRMEPGSGIAGFVDAFKAENPISSLKERTIGAAGPLADRFNQKEEEEDEYDFSDIEGQTALLPLNPLALIGLFKSGTTAKGITKTLLKNKIQKEIGKKFIRPKIIKKLKESAGVEFGGTGKFKNISTSNKDYGPYKKSTPAPKTTPTPARPHGNGGGGGRRPDNPGGFTNPGKGSYGPHKASGGRIGFSKGKLANLARRNFMKLLGGAAAGIGALKTGAFKFLGKEAAPIAEEVVKSAGSGTTPPPYFFNLVNKIRNLGDDVTSKYATQERQKVTKYKDFELTEDIATGEKTIKKFKSSELDEGPSNMVEETYMNYKPGKSKMDETTKGKTPPDEYTEDTTYIRGDGGNKGEIYKTVDGVADDVIEEGTVFEDNITEFGKKITKTKKASGGIARMLGE